MATLDALSVRTATRLPLPQPDVASTLRLVRPSDTEPESPNQNIFYWAQQEADNDRLPSAELFQKNLGVVDVDSANKAARVWPIERLLQWSPEARQVILPILIDECGRFGVQFQGWSNLLANPKSYRGWLNIDGEY